MATVLYTDKTPPSRRIPGDAYNVLRRLVGLYGADLIVLAVRQIECHELSEDFTHTPVLQK